MGGEGSEKSSTDSGFDSDGNSWFWFCGFSEF
jgi:hypothetical protein